MPYIVPAPYPAPRTGFGDFSAALGQSIENLPDVLLRAYMLKQQRQADADRLKLQQKQMEQQQSQFNVGRDIDLQQLAEQIRQRKEAGSRSDAETRLNADLALQKMAQEGKQNEISNALALLKAGYAQAPQSDILQPPMPPSQIMDALNRGASLSQENPTYSVPGIPYKVQKIPGAGMSEIPLILANPYTGERKDLGSIPKGSRVITPMQEPAAIQQQQLSGENFADILSRLRGNFDKAQTINRGPMAIASGLGRMAKGAAQLDPDASVYYGLREATKGNAARVISAERGVMTNQDLQRIDSAIPNLMTGRETGHKQFDQLEGIMIDTVANAINRGRSQRGEPLMSTEEVKSKLGFTSQNEGSTSSGIKYKVER